MSDFAATIGAKDFVSGWVMHTVPVAVYAWWKYYGDFRGTIEAVVRCGGDTDSTGAIAGALASRAAEIPQPWVDGIWEWPRSINFLHALGDALETKSGPVPIAAWFVPLRNLFFLAIVLVHLPICWLR